MGNKNKYNTLYYLSIILSVSVIVFSIFCVWLFIKTICHDGSQNCHEELDRLIGLQNVKDRIHEMEARMDY